MRVHLLHNFQIDARALEILATIDEPLESGDQDDDGEDDDAVV